MDREFTDKDIRLADIVSKEGVLDDYTFIGCRILGPAVLALGETTVVGDSGFGEAAPDPVIWDNPPFDRTGAVRVPNCTFLQCMFLLVGFTGSPQILEEFRTSFKR
jgi:hypothetical protein